jgi:putative addiction module component (TIGR02574 family)
MTKAEIAQHALTLPEQDRFDLAETLWASLDEPDAVQAPCALPEWQKQLLDERLEASAGEEGESWDQVRAEIWPEVR